MRIAFPIAAVLLATSALSKSLSGGEDGFCVLQKDGSNYCHGSNFGAMLGIDVSYEAMDSSSTPRKMHNIEGAVDVCSARHHVCVVVNNGAGVKCVGYNEYGQLGDGTTVDRQVPVSVVRLASGNETVSEVACGHSFHNCAILAPSKALRCWGAGTTGAFGDDNNEVSTVPVAPVGNLLDGGVYQVALGEYHTCVITADEGKLLCTGDNEKGQLGDGSTDYRFIFAPVTGLGAGTGFVSVACGIEHTCAVNSNGGVICFGNDAYGNLGRNVGGTGAYSAVPVQVVGLESGVRSVSAGMGSSFAIMDSTGAVKSWGRNNNGMLGSGDKLSRKVPGNFSAERTGMKEVRGAGTATCVLDDGPAFVLSCVGNNDFGQLARSTILYSGDSLTLQTVSGHPDKGSTSSSAAAFNPSWITVCLLALGTVIALLGGGA